MTQLNQLTVILKEQAVTEANATRLLDAFGAPFEEAGEILADYETVKVTNEADTATMAEARTKRLALKKVRVTVENKRKELKEDIVKQGRAIDSVARFVKEVISPAEKYLEEQEKFAETRQAERRLLIIEARGAILRQLVDMPAIYKFEDLTDEDFDKLVAELKAQKFQREEAARLAKEKEEKAAEQERIRQAEVAAENARLKKEAAEREAELAKERAKADEERHAREALEAEQRRATAEKEAAMAREKARAEEAERAAQAAPDKQKLLTFASALATIRAEKLPTLATEEAKAILHEVDEGLHRLEKIIIIKTESL